MILLLSISLLISFGWSGHQFQKFYIFTLNFSLLAACAVILYIVILYVNNVLYLYNLLPLSSFNFMFNFYITLYWNSNNFYFYFFICVLVLMSISSRKLTLVRFTGWFFILASFAILFSKPLSWFAFLSYTNWLNLCNFDINYLLLNSLNSIHPLFLYTAFSFLFVYFLNLNYTELPYKRFSFYNLSVLGYSGCTLCAVYLGGWWALQEGNWGGWWAWDPSEVFSLFLISFILIIFHFRCNANTVFFVKYAYFMYILTIVTFYIFLQLNFTLTSHTFIAASVLKLTLFKYFYFSISYFLLLYAGSFYRNYQSLYFRFKAATPRYFYVLLLFSLCVSLVLNYYNELVVFFIWKTYGFDIIIPNQLPFYFNFMVVCLLYLTLRFNFTVFTSALTLSVFSMLGGFTQILRLKVRVPGIQLLHYFILVFSFLGLISLYFNYFGLLYGAAYSLNLNLTGSLVNPNYYLYSYNDFFINFTEPSVSLFSSHSLLHPYLVIFNYFTQFNVLGCSVAEFYSYLYLYKELIHYYLNANLACLSIVLLALYLFLVRGLRFCYKVVF